MKTKLEIQNREQCFFFFYFQADVVSDKLHVEVLG